MMTDPLAMRTRDLRNKCNSTITGPKSWHMPFVFLVILSVTAHDA